MASILANNAHSILMGSNLFASTSTLATGAAAAIASVMYLDAKNNVVEDWRKIVRDVGTFRYLQDQVAQGRAHCLTRYKENVARLPNKIAIRGSDFREWTYTQTDQISTRIANYILENLGMSKGESVALLFENSAQMCFCMLGTFKAGCVMTPQNTNLRGAALLHCLKISSSRVLIFESTFISAVAEILPELQALGIKLVLWSYADDVPGLAEEAPSFEVTDVLSEKRLEGFGKALEGEERIKKIMKETVAQDPASIIFTSGTTGLPKGGQRDHFYLLALTYENNLTFHTPLESDTMLGASPLYHAQAFGPFMLCMARGATFVPLRKFSASSFWQQCIDYQITTFWYIGEMCRYLLVQPPGPADKAHKVRRIQGAGLRRDIFREFYDRFNLDTIIEFYAASDGTSTLINVYNGSVEGVGSVGKRGPLYRWFTGAPRLIKVDELTEKPIRDPKTGLCIEAKTGEAGDCIGMYDASLPGQPSYKNNPEATTKKIIRDVFKKGDTWWRMGDLLSRDESGWYYFKDRIGDTYRWKSENVSTMEVGNLIAEYKSLQEVNVYGVEVPGNDGRAGMAAVVIHDAAKSRNLDDIMKELGKHAVKVLPRYAVPIFIRVLPDMEITGTMKHRKVEYQKEGFQAADYWMAPGSSVYVRFTDADRNKMSAGKSKL